LRGTAKRGKIDLEAIQMADDWITTRQAVQISAYHADTIRELIREGRIKGKKFGEVWQVSHKSLSAYLREQSKRGEKRGPKPLT
jgi:excisionase family DNA binding protein